MLDVTAKVNELHKLGEELGTYDNVTLIDGKYYTDDASGLNDSLKTARYNNRDKYITVEQEQRGNMLRITVNGNTYPIKDTLKANGYAWNGTQWAKEFDLMDAEVFEAEKALWQKLEAEALVRH